MRDLLRLKLADALTAAIPEFTRRDVRLPAVPGKALAVIGVRRSGKTTFLWQCLAERLAAGAPREALLLLGLEDDRLAGMQVADLAWLVEEYFRQYPAHRGQGGTTFFLDEIQTVPAWETLVRRLIDTEKIDLFLSGSSAKLLSREVATSMRGRALEVLVHPFSFREALRHTGDEPERPWSKLTSPTRSALDHRLRRYLIEGGFPEAQGVIERDRFALLQSYVDVVVLRDVIERYAVSNPLPLRWMQRQLLANPAGLFSVQKFYAALRSQGVPVGKDTLYVYLAYLVDAFLVRTISLHTASERRRMVSPRKSYPVDPGLIPLYERSGRSNLGHSLETVVYLELERRGYEAGYVRTAEGFEVDFFATAPGLQTLLMQVCVDIDPPQTYDREVRALLSAASEYSRATPVLVTLETTPPRQELPPPLVWLSAAEWLLAEPARSLSEPSS
ncbi:MAG: ATP-binding protein [Anaerolineales bacterium]